MALVGLLPFKSGSGSSHTSSSSTVVCLIHGVGLTKGLLVAAAVDLLSWYFLMTGLLMTGSSVFAVIYGSNTL
jgi:hypothetical protein